MKNICNGFFTDRLSFRDESLIIKSEKSYNNTWESDCLFTFQAIPDKCVANFDNETATYPLKEYEQLGGTMTVGNDFDTEQRPEECPEDDCDWDFENEETPCTKKDTKAATKEAFGDTGLNYILFITTQMWHLTLYTNPRIYTIMIFLLPYHYFSHRFNIVFSIS